MPFFKYNQPDRFVVLNTIYRTWSVLFSDTGISQGDSRDENKRIRRHWILAWFSLEIGCWWGRCYTVPWYYFYEHNFYATKFIQTLFICNKIYIGDKVDTVTNLFSAQIYTNIINTVKKILFVTSCQILSNHSEKQPSSRVCLVWIGIGFSE